MCKNPPRTQSAMASETRKPTAASSSKATKNKTFQFKPSKKRSARTKKNKHNSDISDISYQNKDITSKVLAEHFKGKSFQAYGLDIPKIQQVLPTNLPTITAKELRMDNLFELVDGTLALVDYESDYEDSNKVKYINYLTDVVNRYLREQADCPPLRMIVIYTGDIAREQVADRYDLGSLKLTVESAFLSEFDGDEALRRLREKVDSGELLSDKEQMEFIILSLSYKDREKKREKIQETVELAIRIQDREQQIFILAGILVFTDKVINQETAKRIRSVINMTKVDMIYYEEKQQALREQAKAFEKKTKALEEKAKKMAERREKQAKETNQKHIALKMIKDHQLSFDKISEYSGLDIEDINRLAASVL